MEQVNIGLMNVSNVTEDMITRPSPFEDIVEFLYTDVGEENICRLNRGERTSGEIEDLWKNAKIQDPEIVNMSMFYGLYFDNATIVTNKKKCYGAAAILDPSIFLDFEEAGTYYAIPSSVHEWILIPGIVGLYVDNFESELNELVQEVNGLIVPENERLSDHVYKINILEGLTVDKERFMTMMV